MEGYEEDIDLAEEIDLLTNEYTGVDEDLEEDGIVLQNEFRISGVTVHIESKQLLSIHFYFFII